MSTPNILLILTDQQNFRMMSCAGNPYLRTPAMDSLAETGVRFDRAYCTNPVCVPSRLSLMTGRMPSHIDLRSNDASHMDSVPPEVRNKGIGWALREAGYETLYGGKVHLPHMGAEDVGFDVLTPDCRDVLASECADYLSGDHRRPFFMVASFVNPHDICYMAIRDHMATDSARSLVDRAERELAELGAALEIPEGVDREEFFEKLCPPLPPNHRPQQDEPEAIQGIREQRPFKDNAYRNWSEERWRMHRWAYCRLTERADEHIGRVLNALRESGHEEDTLVIFTSDHGDMDSAHGMEHKTTLYEEAVHKPLLLSWKGHAPAGVGDGEHLISNGLDILPTVWDYAGVKLPPDLPGRSLRPLISAEGAGDWRECVKVESEFGRMVCSGRYKYELYDSGANREQLIDLERDPDEMRNMAEEPEYAEVLAEHRRLFQKKFPGVPSHPSA